MMEPTVTQNGALYFAQHKIFRRRGMLARLLGAAGKKRRQLSAELRGELFVLPRFNALNQR